MSSPEKIEIHPGDECTICTGSGPCGDPDCKYGQAYEAEQRRKMKEDSELENNVEVINPKSEKTSETRITTHDDGLDFTPQGDITNTSEDRK